MCSSRCLGLPLNFLAAIPNDWSGASLKWLHPLFESRLRDDAGRRPIDDARSSQRGHSRPAIYLMRGVGGEPSESCGPSSGLLCLSLCFCHARASAAPSSFVPGPTTGFGYIGSGALSYGSCGLSLRCISSLLLKNRGCCRYNVPVRTGRQSSLVMVRGIAVATCPTGMRCRRPLEDRLQAVNLLRVTLVAAR